MKAAKGRPDGNGDIESLLTECIERYSSSGWSGVEQYCAQHPAHAERLRDRLAKLRDVGLLGEAADPSVPRTFGAYRILRRLGQGGMGVVYLVRDEARGTAVALKLGPLLDHGGERVRARFEREIRAVSRLVHPSIVRILECGEAEGRPYYTMEFVRGATLARVVSELRSSGKPCETLQPGDVSRIVLELQEQDGEPAPEPGDWRRSFVECACRWVLDVAHGLAYAHANGIVHRDVNPSNILVRCDGRAQLFDLGLASVNDAPTITRSGDFAGTPHYVSPEQIAGRPQEVDHRTDVYSLGVTLFELLTLRKPFEARSTAAVLEKIRTGEPTALRRLNSALPRDLATICSTAMAREPAARYATMDAMVGDLERFLALQPIVAQPLGALRRLWQAARRRKAASLAAGLGAFVLIALPILLLWANVSIRGERDRADDAAREARRRAEESAEVTEYLVAFFELDEYGIDGDLVTARELLERSTADLERQFPDRPLVRAALMEATGRVYRNLGLPERALPWLDRALHLRQRELGEEHRETAEVLQTLAEVHLDSGNVADARALWLRALGALDGSQLGTSAQAVCARVGLARTLRALGNPLEAERELERALAIQGELAGDEALAEILVETAELAWERDAFELAAEHFDAALAVLHRSWTAEPARLARALEGGVRAAEAVGRHDRARALRAQLERLRQGREQDAAAGVPSPRGLVPSDFPVPLVAPWKADFDRSFQDGITALQTKRYDAAVRAFERCLEWNAQHAVSAYNIVCGLTLAGEGDRALDGLDRAVELGLAYEDERFVGAQRDPDLSELRDHPRWHTALERMREMRAAVRADCAEPASAWPDTITGDAAPGLLVVLHGEGGTKEDGVGEPWRALARELEIALLAPAAPFPLSTRPRAGARWFEDVEDYLRHPEELASTLLATVRGFCDERGIDSDRVWIAGTGQGALVAFDLALRAPALFRGVVLVDGPPHPSFDEERVRRAASVGLVTRIVVNSGSRTYGSVAGQDANVLTRDIESWLRGRGLAAERHASLRSALLALAERGDRGD